MDLGLTSRLCKNLEFQTMKLHFKKSLEQEHIMFVGTGLTMKEPKLGSMLDGQIVGVKLKYLIRHQRSSLKSSRQPKYPRGSRKAKE